MLTPTVYYTAAREAFDRDLAAGRITLEEHLDYTRELRKELEEELDGIDRPSTWSDCR